MSVPEPSPLIVVPCAAGLGLDVAAQCLVRLWGTVGGADVLVIGHPDADPMAAAQIAAACAELGFLYGEPDTVEPRGATVNAALESALEEGHDLILLAPDVEPHAEGWVQALHARADSTGRPAAVVGGRLLHPAGLVEHAGLQFSLLQNEFVDRFRLGPASLEQSRVPSLRPVGPGMVLIRHRTLEAVGLLDPALPGLEIVDYCLRCFAAGLESIYEPAAVGTCHRDLYARQKRTEAEKRSAHVLASALAHKHAGALARWIAPIRGEEPAVA